MDFPIIADLAIVRESCILFALAVSLFVCFSLPCLKRLGSPAILVAEAVFRNNHRFRNVLLVGYKALLVGYKAL